jgi:hypothetical protein
MLTGVKMAGFAHRLGFEIKIFQIFYLPQNFTLHLIFYPVFSLKNPAVPGCSAQILPPFRLQCPPLLAIFKSSDGDAVRPVEKLTDGHYSRRRIDRELSCYIGPGTLALVYDN